MKLNYIIIPLIVLATSLLGSLFTNKGMEWYNTLKLPSITPPGSVIGAVWTVIFILSAISAIIVWNKAKHDNIFWIIIAIFIVNALLNALWSYLFFYQGLLLAPIIEMIVLNLTTLALIILIWPISKLASALLIPYFIWVSFATYLATTIWQINK